MAGSAAGSTLETRPDIYPIPGILPDDTPYFTPDTQTGTQLERAKAEVQSSGLQGGGYESNAVFGDKPEPLLPTEKRRHNFEHFIANARRQSACAAQIDKAVMVALRDVCRLDAGRSVERWAELLPPLLEDRCQVAALSQSPAEQGGLQCAESCVAGGGCIQQGEEVVNDHRPNEWVPRVTSVGQQGLCDLASASCVAISIRGRHLWPSVGLRCRVRQGEQAWNIAPATYRSAEEVQCHLPVASVRRLRHTADVVPWTIQVSYNGVIWSDAVVLKTYNSDCQICRERNGSVSCAPVIDSCIINGQCYRSGDTNPKNPCRYCGSNRHQWVTRVDDGCRGGRPVTCQTVGPACQHGLCVEDSRGAICVCHPGYIGSHCQIRETPPDFITLAEEMGDEALYAPREALDFRYR
ncbi:von Willebrand factor D and EGF domain-containing protein-like [Amphibalanus amphitrite]|uniref:von Willebrand factor D and EGF domain-containing protein-like n=1 Tax=Amphibalanus amphitrite TaxID=1232801 RepID=UPI001C91ABE7|nr:von Willebrand factor D and EGF domain-containing protein-like [Amphibalanus amphitrite]